MNLISTIHKSFPIIVSPLETFVGLQATTNNSPKFYCNPKIGLETHTKVTDIDFYILVLKLIV